MKKKISIMTGLVIASLIGYGVVKYRSASTMQTVPDVWVQASKVSIARLPLEATSMGTLVARSVEITPEMAGHVDSILFKDGTFVKKGTPLIQLDDVIYKAQSDSAKAQLAYSENDYRRKSLLGKQGAVTQQAIDQAYADLKEKRATSQERGVMVSKMKLEAPFDGIVGKSKVNPGDYVTTGVSLVTLTDTRHLRVEYNVPEKFLPLLKLGQTVKVTSSTYPGKEFSGKVSYIAPTINAENRSISLYADVNNDANRLVSGMFVSVSQALGTEEKVVLIPARSLVPVLEGEQVFKVTEGKAAAVSVVVGKRIHNSIQITEGLNPGDMVITDGQLKVKNGMPVKVKDERNES